jgi:hypothetical protein
VDSDTTEATSGHVYVASESIGQAPLFGSFDIEVTTSTGNSSLVTIEHDSSAEGLHLQLLKAPGVAESGLSVDVQRTTNGIGGGYAWTVTFAAPKQESDAMTGIATGWIPTIQASAFPSGGRLGGTGASFEVVEGKVAGLVDDAQVVVAAGLVTDTIHEVQRITCAASTNGYQPISPDALKTFTLFFRGYTTEPISIYAAPTPNELPSCLPAGGPSPCAGDGSTLQEKLEALPTVNSIRVDFPGRTINNSSDLGTDGKPLT